jgi:hypothetical protein
MANKVKLGYRIHKILSTKFSFEDIGESELEKLLKEPKVLGININTALEFNNEKSTITFDINTSLFRSIDKKKLVGHTGRTSYLVDGLLSTYNNETGSYDLPDALMLQMAGIAFSHARALLATELNPTVFNNKYFLPVINPKTLLPKKENNEDHSA